jgi:hypothetical protein
MIKIPIRNGYLQPTIPIIIDPRIGCWKTKEKRQARVFSALSALFISLGSAHPNIAAASFPIAAARLSLDFAA